MSLHSKDLQIKYDRLAPIYDLWDIVPEFLFYSSWRLQLWEKVTPGHILEIGAGTGKNMRYYPPGSTVTAIDISPVMLDKATKRKALNIESDIEIYAMDVCELIFEDGTFDAIVGSFILTVLSNPAVALRELKRVCKPGCPIFLLEFTGADNRFVATLQDMIAPLTRTVYCAYVNRDTISLVTQSGFKITDIKNVGDGWVKIIQAVNPGT